MQRRSTALLSYLLFVALLVPAPTARAVTLGFDELIPFRAADFTVAGVRIHIQEGYYGPFSFGHVVPLVGPSLSANPRSGLVLELDTPTAELSFSLNVSSNALDPPLTVEMELFDAAGASLGLVPVSLSGDDWARGVFEYGGVAISKAVLHSDLDTAIDIDELTYVNEAVNLVRALGVDGADAPPGPAGPGLPGGDAMITADSGTRIQHAVAAGGMGGSGIGAVPGDGGDGGAGGAATATAFADTTGVESSDATAVAFGGVGGRATKGNLGGPGGAAFGEAHATSEQGDARALAQALGGRGGGSPGGAGGSAAATATAASSDGGDATAHVQAVGGSGGGGSSGQPSGDGGDVTLVDAVDGSTTGVLSLIQEAEGGWTSSSDEGVSGRGGHATSHLGRDASAERFFMRVRAEGGEVRSSRRGTSDGSGGDAEARGIAHNDAGEVSLLVRAEGGEAGGSQANDSAGGTASVVAEAGTTGDFRAVRVGDPDEPYAWGALGGRGGYSDSQTDGAPGGDGTSRSSGVAEGNSLVYVYDRASGGAGGHARLGSETSGGDGGQADSFATGSNAGYAGVVVSAHAEGGEGGRGSTAGQFSGDGGHAAARAEGASSGGGDVYVIALAEGGRSADHYGPNRDDGESGGYGGGAEASAHGTSTTGDVEVIARQVGGSGGAADGTGKGGRGADSILMDGVTGATAGLLTLHQEARAGPGGSSAGGTATTGRGGDAESHLTGTNPGGGALRVESHAEGGGGGRLFGDTSGRQAGDGGDAWATAHGSNGNDATLEVEATAEGGISGYVRGTGQVAGRAGDARADASGISTADAPVRVTAQADAGWNRGETFGASPTPGNATATADATTLGDAQVRALADVLRDEHRRSATGQARAVATMDAASGQLLARATAADSPAPGTPRVVATASAPAAGADAVEARANLEGDLPVGPPDEHRDAFVFAAGFPRAVDLETILSLQPRLASNLGPALALAIAGFAPDEDSEQLSTDLTITFDPDGQDRIAVGFVDPVLEGTFTSLSFRVAIDDETVEERTFAAARNALAYFEQELTPGLALPAGTDPQTLKILLQVEGAAGGMLLQMGLVVAAPEAPVGVLLGVGIIAMAGRAWRRRPTWRRGGARPSSWERPRVE